MLNDLIIGISLIIIGVLSLIFILKNQKKNKGKKTTGAKGSLLVQNYIIGFFLIIIGLILVFKFLNISKLLFYHK